MKPFFGIKTPAADIAQEVASVYDLSNYGLKNLNQVYWNLSVAALYEEILFRREGQLSTGGSIIVETGRHTARSANDKFIVKEATTENSIWWGEYNYPFNPDKFNLVLSRMQGYLQDRDLFVQDCYVGADPVYRLPIRIVTEYAWHSLFAKNMFVPVDSYDELRKHVPEFTVICVPSFQGLPAIDGTNIGTFILLNFDQRLVLIGGSAYGGEIKKSVFTIMNYLLPLQGVMPMHCSANMGDDKDAALFFGLSGTGKTTLSADPGRHLIGDDEHGWGDQGVFNFENGCYAKVIQLSPEAEPQIYATTHRFGTILENVVQDPVSRTLDLDDDRLTENTRGSYPLNFIENAVDEKSGGHPKNIIMLTCDANGVLPPIAKLTPDQAIYHFISGYTSKVSGTEIDLGVEPEITFSTCFGAPFMVHHPYTYANLLKNKIIKHKVDCWLVNTGWTGGPFGIGKRISIQFTRILLNDALSGKLKNVKFRKDAVFGFQVPVECPGVPTDILDPASSWSDPKAFVQKYHQLASLFIENFKKFASECPEEVIKAGPVLNKKK
jgi:phosphoenolpyruvate carboxykinase (ATP)